MFIRNKFLSVLIIILLFSGFVTKDNDLYFEINKGIDIFGRVYKEVALNYVDELNPEEFMLAGINGMLESLDPYTNFIDGSSQKDIDIITKGKYGGIGATVGLRNNDITIVDLIEGYSAQRQGLRIGDIIIQIDSVKVNKENYNELGEYLKGEPGTPLSILIKRDGSQENILFKLIREEIEVKNLSYYAFYPENSNNAYLKLSSFTRTAGDEVKKALLDLSARKNIESITLDLRGNPGGLLDAAIDVSEKFLKKGELIVSVRGRDTIETKKYFAAEEPIAVDEKLVILIDEASASASEIVAGAMQDHDRAVVVGANSFGKGLVQTIIPLSYNTSLKITTARYFTPSGRSIQKLDYSNKNKVFQESKKILNSKFQTDNNREVLSAGGITPDSIVSNRTSSFVIQKLLAEGMFFQFATYLFNNNPKEDFVKINNQKLIESFLQYLKNSKFEIGSLSQKLIDQLAAAANEEKLDENFIISLSEAKKQISHSQSKEIEKHQEEIISLIREELAARVAGRTGRIKESLKVDSQFIVASKILANEELYRFLLNSRKN
jgi:carboxyl-terminal processing protease